MSSRKQAAKLVMPPPAEVNTSSDESSESGESSGSEAEQEQLKQSTQPQVNLQPTVKKGLLQKKIKTVGTREEVYNGEAVHTTGWLHRGDIVYDERTGIYKSVKRVEASKKMVEENRSIMNRKSKQEAAEDSGELDAEPAAAPVAKPPTKVKAAVAAIEAGHAEAPKKRVSKKQLAASAELELSQSTQPIQTSPVTPSAPKKLTRTKPSKKLEEIETVEPFYPNPEATAVSVDSSASAKKSGRPKKVTIEA